MPQVYPATDEMNAQILPQQRPGISGEGGTPDPAIGKLGRARSWIGVALLLLGLTGCSGVTSIEAVHARPRRNWLTSTVHLKGTVVDRAPLIDQLVYELQDSTGTIWVLTNRIDQPTGEQILIRGQVRYQSIPLADQELGEAYIEEQQLVERGTHD